MSDVFVAVKRLINRSGMSAWNVAHKAGCSERTISNWMNDRVVTEPHLETLLAVAKVFGKAIVLTDGEAQIVDAMPDTPASVAMKMQKAHEFVGYWRRWQ
jgi:transcriptional regulator with XRE-family HTH domain